MKLLRPRLCILALAFLAGVRAHAANTPTWTETVTPTITPTPTASFTISQTPTSTFTICVGCTSTDSPTQTPSPSATPSDTPTIDVNATLAAGSWTPTASVTPTFSPPPSLTASPTPTPLGTPGGMVSDVVDNFEDGDAITINGGAIFTSIDAVGSSCSLSFPSGGCTFGSTLMRCNLSGSVAPASAQVFDSCIFNLAAGTGACDLRPWALQHSLSFSFRNNTPGVSYQVCLPSASNGDADYYCFSFTPAGSGWQTLTVYFPDVPAATGINRFQQAGFGAVVPWSTAVTDVTGCSISALPQGGVSTPFNLDLDDITFGPPPSGNNPLAVAAAFGVSVTDVLDAQSLGLEESMEWIVLRLAAHCGCHPHDILQMRDTLSWGQIATTVGTTWAAIVAEVQGMSTGASLSAMPASPTQVLRGLANHPAETPVPAPAPYVPQSEMPPVAAPYPGCQ